MSEPKIYPKCNQSVVRGFVIDPVRRLGYWFEGEPVHYLWTNIKRPLKPALPTGTYKCRACGFFESYAAAEYKMK
jgi:hypothetical protein